MAIAYLCIGCSPTPDSIQVLRQAQLSRPAAEAQATTIQLPDAWNSMGRSGLWDYQLHFDAPNTTNELWGAYIPRLGNRAQILLNGHEIAQLGQLEHNDQTDFAQRPHFFVFPRPITQAGLNTLTVRLEGEPARYGGLSRLYIGPMQLVLDMYRQRELWQTTGSFAIVMIAALLGALSVVLYWERPDRALGYFAAACVFCAIRTSYAVVTVPPMDYHWWSWLVDSCYLGYLLCLCAFCLEVMALRGEWLKWFSIATIFLSTALISTHAFGRLAMARQIWLMVMLAYASTVSLTIWRTWWRVRDRTSLVLALAALVAMALAIYDHLVTFYAPDGYGAFALARYSLLVFLIAMAWLLVQRYTRQVQTEARLRARFEQETRAAREQARQQTQQKILRDIHDGLGLQLNGLLRMVEPPIATPAALSLEIRTVIEQMRLLVNSSERFEGDVSMLLGDIRHSIERRLRYAGLSLEWRTELTHPERRLLEDHAAALRRVFFELTTNVMKHAQASSISVWVNDDEAETGIHIEFEDDGAGFDPATTRRGIGCHSIERRIKDMGGQLEMRSSDGKGTRYVLRLPHSVFDMSVDHENL